MERDNRSRFRWTNNRQGVEHIVISYTKGYNISIKNNHKGITYDIRRGHHKNTLSQKLYRKNADHENTHHTRQGGRTDHSTSSHGLVPSIDRVMEILQTWVFVIFGCENVVKGYMGIHQKMMETIR